MLTTAAASSPAALWYVTRGTGVVTLLLLTLTVAIGVANVRRLQSRRIPRFVVDAVHRNAALLSVAFLAVHVITTLLDTYAKVSLTDVLVPFGAGYSPFWVGLGTLSVDLMLAVVVTSLLRRRVGYRIWRATHWLAYASWPVALLHALGAGTDADTTWMLGLAGGCTLVVLAATAVRFGREPALQAGSGPRRPRPRTASFAR